MYYKKHFFGKHAFPKNNKKVNLNGKNSFSTTITRQSIVTHFFATPNDFDDVQKSATNSNDVKRLYYFGKKKSVDTMQQSS